MNKERFLDVNGFSTEYDIPLEKRLNKYRGEKIKDTSRTSISATEKLQTQSEHWRGNVRRKQIIAAIVGILVFAAVVAAAVYLTYFM